MAGDSEIKALKDPKQEAALLESLQAAFRLHPDIAHLHALEERMSAENELGLGLQYRRQVQQEVSSYDDEHKLSNFTRMAEFQKHFYIETTPEAMAMVKDGEKVQLASLSLKQMMAGDAGDSETENSVLQACLTDVYKHGYGGLTGDAAFKKFSEDLSKSTGYKVTATDDGIDTDGGPDHGKRKLAISCLDDTGSGHVIPFRV